MYTEAEILYTLQLAYYTYVVLQLDG